MKWLNKQDDVTQFVIVGWATATVYYGGMAAVFCTACYALYSVVMK